MPQFSPDQCTFGDVAGYGFWDAQHAREHLQMVNILAAQGRMLPAPDLLQLLTAGQGRASIMQSHFSIHQQLRQITGVDGIDLSQGNLSDQGDFYSWLGYHAQEHAQLRQALGIV